MYRIIVENRSTATAHHVTVRNLLPANTKLVWAKPKPAPKEPSITWLLGSLEGGAVHELIFVLEATGAGPIQNCARVTFEHGLCTTTEIAAPVLNLKKQGPTEAQVGETLNYQLIVTNRGTAPAANVLVTDQLPEGLTHAGGQNPLTFRIGTLTPGESKSIPYQLSARGQGRLTNKAVATADGGFKAQTEWTVVVTQAKLELSKAGPARVYAGSEVPYRLTIKNTGTGPARSVVLSDPLPAQALFVSASDGGAAVGGEVRWSLGTLPAGATKTVELTVKPRAVGQVVNRARATGEPRLEAMAEFKTEVLGAPALLLEAIDTADPIVVGETTSYVIVVGNQGSVPATNVKITATGPAEIVVTDAQGPVNHQKTAQQVTFEAHTIPPKGTAEYRVTIRGVKAADVRFRVQLTADQLTAGPVHEEESTNVFSENGGK